jgi:hypothetical protein
VTWIAVRSRADIVAENLFLRRQLALYLERKARRRRATPATKLVLVLLSRGFPWAPALAIVKPSTFVRWHRAGFRLWWRWKSRPVGRPPLPGSLRNSSPWRQENPTWGEGRIADGLSLKLGIRVDARTVGKYRKQGRHTALGPGFPEPHQATVARGRHGHKLPPGYRVAKNSVWGGLHHDYRLEEEVA